MFCLIFRLQISNKYISMNTYIKSFGYDEDLLETVYTDKEYMDVFYQLEQTDLMSFEICLSWQLLCWKV